ncbi:MAG: HNH endonuclease [Elusimicrobia bacterium]|nr:HNH endonuclease [Elusimicrobiota bacterium]
METGLAYHSDANVELALKQAVLNEAASIVQVLRCLIEFDQRDLVSETPYPSLYHYCTTELGYSPEAAYKRIRVARKAVEFPDLLRLLEENKADLARLVAVSAHLTHENESDLLRRACEMKREQLEFYVAGLAPKPATRDLIRPLTAAPPQLALPAPPVSAPEPAAEALPPPVPQPAAAVEPLSEKLARIFFTADQQTVEDLERLCRLRRCRRGNSGIVIAEALRRMREDIDPDLRLVSKRPRASRPATPGSRYIPQHVKDAVWRRDEGQCAFRDKKGRRCCARENLQFDHIRPFADGGVSDDPDNIRLLCPLHNLAEARRRFGDGWIDRAIEARRQKSDNDGGGDPSVPG